MNRREFEAKYGVLLASLGATVTSLAAPENVVDITDKQWREIDEIYRRLLKIQQNVVSGTPV